MHVPVFLSVKPYPILLNLKKKKKLIVLIVTLKMKKKFSPTKSTIDQKARNKKSFFRAHT
jgi:hypothetical protein